MKQLDLFMNWATDPKLAVLDTETTGLHGEVIEIGIVDGLGRTLFDERMRPSAKYPVEPGAQAIHGITNADLAGLPTIAEHWPMLSLIFSEYNVVVYNKAFDHPRLSLRLDNAMPQWFVGPGSDGDNFSDAYRPFQRFSRESQCVMLAYAPIHGIEGRYGGWKWAKLLEACDEQGVNRDDLKPHNALSDALMTLRLIQAVARLTPQDLPHLLEDDGA